MLIPPSVLTIQGLPIHLLADYAQWLRERVEQGQGTQVVTLNAEMVMQAAQNPSLKAVIQQAELVVPDGVGVTWYLKLRRRGTYHAPGIDLVSQVLAHLQGKAVFFLGGAPEVGERAAQYWRQRNPNLVMAGVRHGYFSPAEEAEIVAQLQRQQPRLILVALGVPRQEIWIQKHRHICPQSVWVGVGGSLDIWAGVKVRAPLWMRRLYLEWAFRLYQEPWRWRRMLALPQFAGRVLLPALWGGGE
ncbi:glycosyl transferase, WecB/TagA/CpsF family [Gloeomargarita lithophora Alchichica-D10]|uniref:Glycosyl transferase, WecB/TagA/CpsF family n=1 Tax=Gloeomargarita lithophora Alchichica-D10 TaxID=1188229 RepID=A0A1J0AAC5_9CYAN|nr:WecB/TagA/CpsF family glycosyltransferase [Gloeomargarita lithophora]APB32857.1 glycosyl transferase, WecB/TagA/CpsF family [Gloeomargarita lithophora Alchichica-D10]